METKDLIKELRILEKSSKLGEQACICGEAANRLEELLQEIEISRRLEKSENHKENDDRKQLLSKNKINARWAERIRFFISFFITPSPPCSSESG